MSSTYLMSYDTGPENGMYLGSAGILILPSMHTAAPVTSLRKETHFPFLASLTR